jgi:hypothetical protein
VILRATFRERDFKNHRPQDTSAAPGLSGNYGRCSYGEALVWPIAISANAETASRIYESRAGHTNWIRQQALVGQGIDEKALMLTVQAQMVWPIQLCQTGPRIPRSWRVHY